MIPSMAAVRRRTLGGLGIAVLALGIGLSTPAGAQVTAFKQAVAEAATQDEAIAAFYRSIDYAPFWTADDEAGRQRRAALIAALETADMHGLPGRRYDRAGLMVKLRSVRSTRERGFLEFEMSRLFLRFARDLQTGALEPRRVDSGIVREVPYRDRATLLSEFAAAAPLRFMRSLAPSSREYANLLKEKVRLERLLSEGGWGEPVAASVLKPGQSGAQVVRLRNRLIRMGYLPLTTGQSYDAKMQSAVQRFQEDHGLFTDGIAGPGTLKEVNTPLEQRLQSVIVAMERERWINKPLGKRHILVNLTDFSARIIDDGRVSFETRSVIGSSEPDRQSPEFSDEMELIVINPTWHVPRSITVKEYLPQLQRNPYAVSHLNIIDRSGRIVNRGSVNFAAYNANNFPFSIKQPPSRSNALGLVKFLFPNKYNIYLHDTPSKSLFQRESRAFSHGCVRLQRPFEFAYALLAPQVADPKGFFHARLNTGRETPVRLKTPVPVHIDYRTALVSDKGRLNFRRDVYGRDAAIWRALANAGVALSAVRG